MWSAYTWMLMVALVAADIDWKTDLLSGKKYTVQVAPDGGTKATFQKSCIDIGGKLPEPRNIKENNFVQKLLKTKGRYGVLGIHGHNGLHYYDNDASLITWENWYHWADGNYDCIEMDNSEGKWSREDCTVLEGRTKFACEKVPIDQPDPGINWKTHLPTGKKYVFQVAPDGGTKATFEDACKKIGGMLPEPKNKEQNDYIEYLLNSITRGFRGKHFLGITKKDDGYYFDSDGTLVSWTNFPRMGGTSKCVDVGRAYGTWHQQDCNLWQKKGMQFLCEKNDDLIVVTTRRRQAIPTSTTKTSEKCEDKQRNCAHYAKNGYCTGKKKKWMSENCCKACRDLTEKCEDKQKNCAHYANKGYCTTKYTKWMSENCCKACRDLTVPTDQPDPGEWITHPSTGKKYKVLKSQWKPPDGNQEACRNIGAVVAEPRSKDENDFLATLQPYTFRLGMSDKAIEGVWTWNSDDSQVVWFNWMQWGQGINSEPNGGLDENCAVLGRLDSLANTGYDQKRWLDVECAGPLGTDVIICEKVEPEEAVDIVVVEYQLTVTIELKITNDDILNTGSEAFIDFAIEVSQVMLKNYQSVNPAVVRVKVTGVRRGSAIVDHNVGVKSADDTSAADEIIATVVKESASLPIVINGTSYKQTLVNKGRVSHAKSRGCGQLHPPAILLSVVLGFCQLIGCW